MKKIMIVILLLLSMTIFAQKVITSSVVIPEYYTVTLDSTSSSIVYYIFPPPMGGIVAHNRTAISTTAPTSASAQAKNLIFDTGGLSISVVADTVVDAAADESDSTYMYAQHLIYDQNEAAWYRVVNDTMFFGIDSTHVTIGDTLLHFAWTTGSCFMIDLNDSLMQAPGIAITIGQVANDQADASNKYYLGFWWKR